MRRGMPVLRSVEARGASMTEYIIIVALVAIFLIGAVGLYGDKIKSLIMGSRDKMGAVENRARGGGGGGGGHTVIDGR
ncbi:MAG: Flp family type IVb pilin [Planctomycetes bacterium]|nr:Flp family type IVb pilin [Planctomycetota bacterium]